MRKSAELRKAQIVAVILDLADRIGPDRVTTGAVAAEVGVTQAAIFRHFPTKAEMWVAVADHVAGLLTAAWAEALEGVQAAGRTVEGAGWRATGSDHGAPRDAHAVVLARTERRKRRLARSIPGSSGRVARAFDARSHRRASGTEPLSRMLLPADVAVLLTSLIQGVAIRWSLGARDFVLRDEGLRLLAVQLRLLGVREG